MAKKPKRSEHIRIGERVTIFQCGARGIYTADFYYQGHRTRSLKTSNRTIAIRKAKLIDAELVNGIFVLNDAGPSNPIPSPKLLKEAINDFIAFHRTEGRRHRTVRRYEGMLLEFFRFATEKRISFLDDINLVLIDGYREERQKSLSPRSMHNEASLIKSFLSWCEERELIARNPLYKRKFRRPKPKARKAPSLAQVNMVLDLASALRSPQLAMLAFTGMRSGECRNLLVTDVDFDSNWIQIRSRPGFETKNGEDRTVPIHQRLRVILEQLPRRRSGWFFRALPSNRFPKGDHHLNTKRINEDFQKILTQLELPVGRDEGFTAHSLRRFFRTAAVNAGVPERVVDLWIGHGDTTSMGSLYFDLNDATSQKFMTKIPFGEELPPGGDQ